MTAFRVLALAPVVLSSFALPAEAGGPIEVTYPSPAVDRWVYPFNSTPGYRAVVSVFSALGQENAFPPLSFDQRDGQVLVGFDTGAAVPVGRGLCGYRIEQAVLTMTLSEDELFRYDPTYDAWTTYLPGSTDSDGRPVELYGAAFRGGFTAATFIEGSESEPGTPFGPSVSSDVRYVFPTDFAGGVERDVSNNVRDQFDPTPFAIGRNEALIPGQYVPVDTELDFELDIDNPDVQAFLRRQVDEGRIRLVITSLQPASSGGGVGSGEFASFFAKELGIPGIAARLSLTVRLLPDGDTTGDGAVNFNDITSILANWGASGIQGRDGDANCDGVVDFNDITAVLANWGATSP